MPMKTHKQKPKPADTPLKTSKKKDIELTEKELGKVTGGVSLSFAKVQVEYKPQKGD
jgi:hypothetical protein